MWLILQSGNPATGVDANLAGDKFLQTAGRIMAGRRTKSETLIWTETDLHAMRFVGGNTVYRIYEVGECTVASRRCMQTVDNRAYWMGRRNFYVYSGQIQQIPCTVADFVFNNMNLAQSAKIWCQSQTQFGEITWYYPSALSMECDSYVTYNYKDKIWYFGSLDRSGGTQGVFPYPLLVDNTGTMFEHEVPGSNRGGAIPFAETGVIELGDGTYKMSLDRIYPDGATVEGSEFTVYAANEVMEPELEFGPFLSSSIVKTRISARQLRFRVEQVEPGWRFGIPRLRLTRTGWGDS